MGKYDSFLAGLDSGQAPRSAEGAPQNRNKNPGKFSGYVEDLDTASSGQPGFYGESSKKNLPLSDQAALALQMAEVAPTPGRMIQKGLDVAGEKVAEEFGRRGHPTAGALYGTEIQMLPDIAGAAAGLGELATSKAPLAQAIRNSPRMLSPRYDALNEAAGISKELPIRRGYVPKYPGLNGLAQNVPPPEFPNITPKIYPKDTDGFLNFARARIEGLGKDLSAQELNDYKDMINTAIQKNELKQGTKQFAVATKLVKDKINPLLNAAVPGRGELDQIYALSKQLRIAPEIAKKIWAYLGPKLRYGAGVIGVP